MHGLRKYVATRMDQMGKFVTEAIEVQQHYLSSQSTNISDMMARKDKDMDHLSSQVN